MSNTTIPAVPEFYKHADYIRTKLQIQQRKMEFNAEYKKLDREEWAVLQSLLDEEAYEQLTRQQILAWLLTVDWTADYSDDHSVWQRGQQQMAILDKLYRTHPWLKDFVKRHDYLYKSVYNRDGEFEYRLYDAGVLDEADYTSVYLLKETIGKILAYLEQYVTPRQRFYLGGRIADTITIPGDNGRRKPLLTIAIPAELDSAFRKSEHMLIPYIKAMQRGNVAGIDITERVNAPVYEIYHPVVRLCVFLKEA